MFNAKASASPWTCWFGSIGRIFSYLIPVKVKAHNVELVLVVTLVQQQVTRHAEIPLLNVEKILKKSSHLQTDNFLSWNRTTWRPNPIDYKLMNFSFSQTFCDKIL